MLVLELPITRLVEYLFNNRYSCYLHLILEWPSACEQEYQCTTSVRGGHRQSVAPDCIRLQVRLFILFYFQQN